MSVQIVILLNIYIYNLIRDINLCSLMLIRFYLVKIYHLYTESSETSFQRMTKKKLIRESMCN